MVGGSLLLHVGCGSDPLPAWLSHYKETRLDIDNRFGPDIVADMRDLGEIGPFDAIYCSHALEHLPPHDVSVALKEFSRVLRPSGHVVVFVPDLEGVQATDEVLFTAPCGPITGLDLIYGYRLALKEHPYMAHRTGFTSETLKAALTEAGFADAAVVRLSDYAMMGAARK